MSETTPNNIPPLDVEQWIDFVLASAAHRSSNAHEQKFGDMLVKRYFTTLPERYKHDPTATQYFDHMLCAVSSAMRGFSIVRDIFQTNWDDVKERKQADLKRAEQIEMYSPFKKEGIWGKIIGAVAGIGLGAPIVDSLKTHWHSSSLISLLLIAGSIVVGLLGMEIFVEWLRNRQAKRIEASYTDKIVEVWQQRAHEGYRNVIVQFLPLAIEITNRYYPGTYTAEFDTQKIAEITERHFAFKIKESPLSKKEQKSLPVDGLGNNLLTAKNEHEA